MKLYTGMPPTSFDDWVREKNRIPVPSGQNECREGTQDHGSVHEPRTVCNNLIRSGMSDQKQARKATQNQAMAAMKHAAWSSPLFFI